MDKLLKTLRTWAALLLLQAVLAACGAQAAGAQPDARGPEIWLYANDASATALQQAGIRQQDLIDRWDWFFRRAGMPWRRVGPKELKAAGLAADKPLSRPAVLILPSVTVMDDEERLAVRHLLDLGVGVLATWKTGRLDAAGNDRGDEFLQRHFGVRVVGEIAPDQPQWFLMPFGESPLTHRLPAGKRIWLGRTVQPLQRIEAPHPAGRFASYDYIGPEDGRGNGALAFAETGAGRSVYFGFAESAWDTAGHDLDDIARGALAWLQRQPQIFKAAWPAPYRAAQLLEMDTEWQFANATRFAAMLESIDARGTFYCLTSEAAKKPDIVRSLMQRHEIGFHAEVHTGFRDLVEKEQGTRLRSMLAEMSGITGHRLLPEHNGWLARLRRGAGELLARANIRPAFLADGPGKPDNPHHYTGFRAPTESFDLTTERLLRRLGIRHHASSPDSTDALLPRFSDAEPDLDSEAALVRLPRMLRDDVSFRRWGYGRSKIVDALVTDLNLALEASGFNLLSVHSQYFGPGGPMTEALPAVLAEIRRHRDRLWVASAGEIAAWWRMRERVGFEIAARDDGLELRLKVRRPGDASRVSFVVTHPHKDARPRVEPEGLLPINPPRATVRRIDDWRSAIDFGTLPTGNFRYAVSFR